MNIEIIGPDTETTEAVARVIRERTGAHPVTGVRECRQTGQYVPTLDGKDLSPTSFDPDRAKAIAEQAALPRPGQVFITAEQSALKSRLKDESEAVYRETGRTPRQLADERAELLKRLEAVHAWLIAPDTSPETLDHFRRLTCPTPAQSGHPKTYRIAHNVGKARYTVSDHDGIQTHKDGSPFFGIEIFSNRKDRDAYVAKLRNQGYTEQ